MNNYIKAIIIDDEQDGRLILASMLKEYCQTVTVLGSYESAESGLHAIKTLEPDLVFLDIEMPTMNAFSMLEQLNSINFEVIFVTAYNHYALKAIKHNAMEYILKPVDKDDLIASVEKYHKKISTHRIAASVNGNERGNNKLVLAARDGFWFVEVSKIVRCEGDGNYTHIYLDDNQKHVASKTLKDFEQLLPSSFLRIHKSHLINANFIKKYNKGEGGTVIMSDDSELEVSRRNKDAFLKYFNI